MWTEPLVLTREMHCEVQICSLDVVSMVVQWVVFAASELQGPGFDPQLVLLSVQVFCSLHVYLGFFSLSKNMQVGELGTVG